jgi:hypothetical protein
MQMLVREIMRIFELVLFADFDASCSRALAECL